MLHSGPPRASLLMAPPVGAVATSPLPQFGTPAPHNVSKSYPGTQKHHNRERLQYNHKDLNSNRRKIRRQASLKTIQEENMPVTPSALDRNLRPVTSTPRPLKQQQSQPQPILTPVSNAIPQSDLQHTVSAFIPDDDMPLAMGAEETGNHGNGFHGHENGYHGNDSYGDDSSLVGFDNLVKVMSFHPKYLDSFLKSHAHLLTGDGPLPFLHRTYIAIMAVSRHRCSHLVQSLSRDFLNLGGNPDWLDGLNHVPQKLRNLSEINKILAHQPWLISKDHIRQLTKCENAWSVSELVHALTLMAHFHALTCFVFGCGLQRDASKPPSPQPGSPNNENSSPMEGNWMDTVLEKMQRIKHEEITQEESVKRFFTVGSQTAELPISRNNALKPSRDSTSSEQIQKFVEDPDFSYVDFAKSQSTSSPEHPSKPPEDQHLCVQDYSWQDHGFSVLNRYYDVGSNLLDEKFSVAWNLTYNTMASHSDVDTSVFRRAVWNYIDVLFGIRHDDYDYKEINELLQQNLKKYIKTVICYPDRVSKKDYHNFMRELKHSEKVHVNILMLEARLQAEMLYALRAVTQHVI